MKSKPAKYGIKFYNLVDIATSMLLECNIYLGASNITNKNMLVGELRNRTVDNFFTSVTLADILYEKKLTMTGTIRANKVNIIVLSFIYLIRQNNIAKLILISLSFSYLKRVRYRHHSKKLLKGQFMSQNSVLMNSKR